MANEVTKKDGVKEPFDPEKIRNSIDKAAQQAELAEERKNEVVEQVANTVIQFAEEKEEITTTEIKEKILSELDQVEPSVSAAWKRYEETKQAQPQEPEQPEQPGKPEEPIV